MNAVYYLFCSELFIVPSKAQVYGHLHNLLISALGSMDNHAVTPIISAVHIVLYCAL